MRHMDTPAERLEWARRRANFTSAAAFARHVDVPDVTYRAHEGGLRGINETYARTYARSLGIRWAWLLTGEGDAFNEGVTFRTAKIPAHPGEAIADGNTATISMEEVDGLLGAGLTEDAANHVVPVGDAGSHYADNVRATWGIPADYLANELKADRARTKIIEVKGDSMEPTLETGDRVMVDPTEQDIASGGIFAIFDGLGMSIRRLEHIPYSEPATVRIISDSPQHGDYERTLEELTIIGRVVWCARRL